MAYLIISDIHANADALLTVLEDARKCGNIEKILCLGDITGYAAEPGACIAIARESDWVCIKGNHDMAVSGEMDARQFNDDAAGAAAWQRRHISLSDRQWLKHLPRTLEVGDFTLAHGSPRDPVWEYVTEPRQAAGSFAHFRTRFCLVGHTHCPVYFVARGRGAEGRLFKPGQPLKLEGRMLINPGSVGQPRDGDPRASYAIYDSEAKSVRIHRISYDIEVTQNRMVELGLPMRLVTRLGHGV